jgi:hypothetical protein
MAIFHAPMFFVPKLRFSFLFTSTYHKQFGQSISISYAFAMSTISFSPLKFPISLNHAEIMIIFFIHFFHASFKASFTASAGMTKTPISGAIGSSVIDENILIHWYSHHFGFTQNFCHVNVHKLSSKSFPIFPFVREAQTITTDDILKKMFIFIVYLNSFKYFSYFVPCNSSFGIK